MQNNIKLQIILGNQYNPYLNLAVESNLLDNFLPNTVSLFLWKNKQTVVIGTNQNPYSECDVTSLIEEGGYLSRRRTGGGAVYHDLGNLNFSFVADNNIYDVKRQMQVIQKALLNFNLETEVSGRNDITYQILRQRFRKDKKPRLAPRNNSDKDRLRTLAEIS